MLSSNMDSLKAEADSVKEELTQLKSTSCALLTTNTLHYKEGSYCMHVYHYRSRDPFTMCTCTFRIVISIRDKRCNVHSLALCVLCV